MTVPDISKLNLFEVERSIWIIQSKVNIPSYDFDFRRFFECRSAHSGDADIVAIARLGAIPDYPKLWSDLHEQGIRLIHSPEESEMAGLLSRWYPKLTDITPKSACYDTFPSTADILKDFDWPVFIKGDRQTSRHSQKLSIARNADEFEYIRQAYRSNPILNWQSVVCREFVSLRKVADSADEKVQRSFEFRFFFWKGQMVSAGPYWHETITYQWNAREEWDASKIASIAAKRINVPFLVVDMAMKENGEW